MNRRVVCLIGLAIPFAVSLLAGRLQAQACVCLHCYSDMQGCDFQCAGGLTCIIRCDGGVCNCANPGQCNTPMGGGGKEFLVVSLFSPQSQADAPQFSRPNKNGVVQALNTTMGPSGSARLLSRITGLPVEAFALGSTVIAVGPEVTSERVQNDAGDGFVFSSQPGTGLARVQIAQLSAGAEIGPTTNFTISANEAAVVSIQVHDLPRLVVIRAVTRDGASQSLDDLIAAHREALQEVMSFPGPTVR